MKLEVDENKLRAKGVRLLVAFGSRVEGKEMPRSDLDIGVSFKPGFGRDFLENIQVISDALGKQDAEIDVAELDRADPLLLFEVASRGVPVFESEPGDFEEFRIRAVKRYYDTAWIRRLERESLRERYG